MLQPIGESLGYCTRRYMNQVFLDRGHESAKIVARASMILIFLIALVFIGCFSLVKVLIIDDLQFHQNTHNILNGAFAFFIIYIVTDLLKDVIRNIQKSVQRYAWSFLSTIVCSYLMTLPMAYTFQYRQYTQLKPGALWLAYSIGNFIWIIMNIFILRETNWPLVERFKRKNTISTRAFTEHSLKSILLTK